MAHDCCQETNSNRASQPRRKPPIAAKPPHIVKQWRARKSRFGSEEAVPTCQDDESNNARDFNQRKTCNARSSEGLANRKKQLRYSASLPNIGAAGRNSFELAGYVSINYPIVAPGTLIKVHELSGELQMLSKQEQEAQLLEENNNIPSKHSPLIRRRGVKVHGSTPAISQQKETDCVSRVDEDGYEMPIAFQKEIYMSLSCDPAATPTAASSADESDAVDSLHVLDKHKKRKKFAKRKRQADAKALHATAVMNNMSKSLSPTSTDAPRSASPLPEVSSVDEATPIESFLSARLRSIETGAASPGMVRSNCTYCPYPMSSSADEWSSFSTDDASDFDDYYHEIDAPDLTGCESDHDYECIDPESLDLAARHHSKVGAEKGKGRTKSSKKKYRLSSKSFAQTHAVTSPLVSPSASRQNQCEIREMHRNECTWDTVATPGVLKLNNFRNLRQAVTKPALSGAC